MRYTKQVMGDCCIVAFIDRANYQHHKSAGLDCQIFPTVVYTTNRHFQRSAKRKGEAMPLDNLWNTARRRSGLARFERECRCELMNNRKRKAYAVPGTREAGERAMLSRRTQEILRQLKADYEEQWNTPKL